MQNDAPFHREYIEFFASNFEIPQPGKGLEFAQQPLYYIVMGLFYKAFSLFGYAFKYNLIFALSCLISCVTLWIGYLIAQRTLETGLPQVTMLSFLSFNPSLIYDAATTNNDIFVFFFGTLALLGLIQIWQSDGHKVYSEFLLALGASLAAFISKLSGCCYVLFLGLLLLYKYWQSKEPYLKVWKKCFQIFCFSSFFILGLVLLRGFEPTLGVFSFINSGVYPEKALPPLDWFYFSKFSFLELLKVAQASNEYVNNDAVRYTFWTHLYGTSFLGDINYSKLLGPYPEFKYISAAIFCLGILFPMLAALSIWESGFFHKTLWLIFVINIIFMICMLRQYPSVCNNSFRYLFSTITIYALLVGHGISLILRHFPPSRRIFGGWIFSISVLQISWIFSLFTVDCEL
ncbi:MAG: hypothetical protein SFT81_01900 [Candidatus Caenarcaniphilales bacterium]|nr:hypothetical protein [Candidatus Caenarcaniphilales bacterium]